ncbi:MAG: sulfotransferase, partial [Desulfobacteraceae bacterium]|nr:sulfotransferase [Desulfobacteraceae bacterium]
MVTSEGKNLFFIFSLPRSGSTLLSIIMEAHSQVYCPPEPWFLLRLAEVYGDPASEKVFDDYYAALATRAFLSEKSFLKSARAFALQAYNDCLDRERCEFFVDKTPRYYH